MIGRWLGRAAPTPLQRAFATLFGVEDFHSHLRLAWLPRFEPAPNAKFVELGCGIGLASIELLTRHPDATGMGFEESAAALDVGRQLAQGLDLERRLIFMTWDLTKGVPDALGDANYVMLLDVLEHVPRPDEVSGRIVQRLGAGARLLISVPTPLYPRVFGRAYHERVGHRHEGFRLDDLDRLFAGLTRVRYRYSTGPLTWAGAAIYYRLGAGSDIPSKGVGLRRLARWLVVLASLPFRFLDFWNGRRVSCSLFVEYVRS